MTTALLIVDMQAGMLMDGRHPVQLDSALANINRLVAACRIAGLPIVFIQHCGDAGTTFAPGSPGWELHPEVDRQPIDTIVSKTTCDSFFQTQLEQTLHKLGVEHLVICGWATDFCVDTTVRSAVSHSFDVTVASDAHTVADRPHLDAAAIIQHHNQTWAALLTSGKPLQVAETALVADGIIGGRYG